MCRPQPAPGSTYRQYALSAQCCRKDTPPADVAAAPSILPCKANQTSDTTRPCPLSARDDFSSEKKWQGNQSPDTAPPRSEGKGPGIGRVRDSILATERSTHETIAPGR